MVPNSDGAARGISKCKRGCPLRTVFFASRMQMGLETGKKGQNKEVECLSTCVRVNKIMYMGEEKAVNVWSSRKYVVPLHPRFLST